MKRAAMRVVTAGSFSATVSLVGAIGLHAPALAQEMKAPKPPADAPAMVVKGKGDNKPLVKPSDAPADKFIRISTPQSPTIAPDGTLYFRERSGTVFQVHSRAAGSSPDAPLTKLTDFADGAAGFGLSPDGKWMVITAAPGGNEQTQVYLLSTEAAAKGGKAGEHVKGVLINPKVQYAPTAWLRDGSGFVYRANDQKPTSYALYIYDIASGKSTQVFNKEGSWSSRQITSDKSRLLVSRYVSASESEVFELTIATGALRDLSFRAGGGGGGGADGKGGKAMANSVIGYTPDEMSVIMSSDTEKGIEGLYVRELASGKATRIAPQWAKYELDGAALSDDRTVLSVTLNEDGYGSVHLLSVPSFTEIPMGATEKGVNAVADIHGKKILYTVNNARTPGVTFMADVNSAGVGTPTAITKADTQGIDLTAFTLPELVTYESFDGTKVPGFLYTPAGYKKGTAIPFVINYHGGPEGQHRPSFSGTIQLLVSRGFGVFLPNVRGSTGYGRDYQMMDDYKKRWDSVRDGHEAAKWLVKNGYAKPGQIAAQGGSYGGFMTVAVLVEDGEQFEKAGGEGKGTRYFGCGADTVGIVNMKTFLEQTADYRRALREAEYGPLSDSEFLTSISPLMRMKAIGAPMLIIHGLNDPRVPVGEAMQLAVALQKRGMDPELIFFPDEGHGAVKLDNRILIAERSLRFFQRTIGK